MKTKRYDNEFNRIFNILEHCYSQHGGRRITELATIASVNHYVIKNRLKFLLELKYIKKETRYIKSNNYSWKTKRTADFYLITPLGQKFMFNIKDIVDYFRKHPLEYRRYS